MRRRGWTRQRARCKSLDYVAIRAKNAFLISSRQVEYRVQGNSAWNSAESRCRRASETVEKYRWPFGASIRVDSIATQWFGAAARRGAIKCRGYRSYGIGMRGRLNPPLKSFLPFRRINSPIPPPPTPPHIGTAVIKATRFAVGGEMLPRAVR